MRKRFSTAAFLTTIAVTCTLIAAAPAAAGTASDESAFVSRINAERASRGLGKLTVKSDLVRVARRHSARMAAKGDIWHNPRLASEVGGNWTELGENVGVGPDVTTLHNAFMASKSHRDNILRRSYNQIGVGVVYGDDGLIYVTEVFAKRGTTQTVSKTTTTRRTSTTKATTTRSRPRAARPARAAAAAEPQPVASAAPVGVTVDLLERMLRLDGAAAA